MANASFDTSFDSSLDFRMNHLKLSDSPSAPALVPDDTPTETYASTFEPTTPPFEPHSPTAEHEDEVEELLEHDLSSLKSADIKADPILLALAKQQARPASQASKGSQGQVGPSAFKARPAPVRQEGAGPRMTKSAALRQGLVWEAPVRRPLQASEGEKSDATKPRDPPKMVASLAAPNVPPRGNRSSVLRSGAGGETSNNLPPKKDYAAQALLNKANEKEERDRRRKSVALPASLSAPSIAPRQNRSSALRTGAPMPSSTASGRTLTSSSAVNVEQAKSGNTPATGLARRASVGVKSLGAPSIAPRLNRAAMLRNPGPDPSTSTALTSSGTAVARPATSHSGSTASLKPTHVRAQSTSSSVKPVPKSSNTAGPKPTKSSLLRAGLGAKVIT